MKLPGPVVTTEWLAQNLSLPRLVVLDGTVKPPGAAGGKPLPHSEIQIPGSRVFDIDGRLSDHSTSLPHMMLSPEDFEREARRLGLSDDSLVVVYDRMGIFSSPRAWWMLKAMGHDAVAVLDGGFPAWVAQARPTERRNDQAVAPGSFTARPRSKHFCDADFVAQALNDPCYAVLDARSPGRFRGTEPEPRPGLRGGHMPGAKNVPFTSVQSQGRMLSLAELARVLEAQAPRDRKLVMSCGSGVTACVLALAAELAGYSDIAVYDGSWSEWGLPGPRPVAND